MNGAGLRPLIYKPCAGGPALAGRMPSRLKPVLRKKAALPAKAGPTEKAVIAYSGIV
jgi:hypothetical protein